MVNLANVQANLAGKTLMAWLTVMATATGAFGGFPEPPQILQTLASLTIFQWLMVFVLIYQGGGGQDLIFSVAATALTYVIYQVLGYFDKEEESLVKTLIPGIGA